MADQLQMICSVYKEMSPQMCAQAWNCILLPLGAQGAKEGHRDLQCSSVCLRGTSEEPFQVATVQS